MGYEFHGSQRSAKTKSEMAKSATLTDYILPLWKNAFRGVLKTQSYICDEAFLREHLMAESRKLFLQKKLHRGSLTGF